MTFDGTHLDCYRGEKAIFDVNPINISGGFLGSDAVRFTAKRDLATTDAGAEIGVDGTFVDANIFRITITDTLTLAVGDITEITELFFSVVWTRGSSNETVLRTGTLWIHPHARSG